MSERKMIEATATLGPALTICPSCRKVVGDTTVLITVPFYNDKLSIPFIPELLKVPFKPAERCQCREANL